MAPAGPPAWQVVPVPHGEELYSFYFGSSSHAAVGGYPIVSAPTGQWECLPLNVNFVGRRFDDANLLCIAHAFEGATQKRISPRFVPTLSAEALLRNSESRRRRREN